MMQYYYIEQHCPICRYGTIGFRMCSDSETIVLMCDECDSVWLDPTQVEDSKALFPKGPDFKIPGLKCSIKPPESRWAFIEEIADWEWAKYIVD